MSLFGDSTFMDVDEGEPPRRCLSDASRLGTLPAVRRDLLRYKLNAFWTGAVPEATPSPLL
jgi:hypothetical protein